MATCEKTPVVVEYTLTLTEREAQYLTTLLYAGVGCSSEHAIYKILSALENVGLKGDTKRDKLKFNPNTGHAYFD